MKPTYTALEALMRTVLILFASTFVGAVVVPLSADGTLPASWAVWRPLLAVSLSAALVAEFVFLRSHLQDARAALIAAGLLPPDAPTTTTTTTTTATRATAPTKPDGFVRAGLVGLLSAVAVGCALFGSVAPPIVDCAGLVVADAAKGMTLVQIIGDKTVDASCGADVGAIVVAILLSADPQVQGSVAYRDAQHARAAIAYVPPASSR